jgi:mannose-1-phosphate guanylyltransferase/MurNAc alpha-1-phosphate uridylyltransferase
VASILPWADAREVAAEPAGLWERFWRDRLAAGALQSIGVGAPFVDCGTPSDYLRANLAALDVASADGPEEPGGGDTARDTSLVGAGALVGPAASVQRSVIGPGARVLGRIRRCVIWPGATVSDGEVLTDAVRTDSGLTVDARTVSPSTG